MLDEDFSAKGVFAKSAVEMREWMDAEMGMMTGGYLSGADAYGMAEPQYYGKILLSFIQRHYTSSVFVLDSMLTRISFLKLVQ